MYCRNPKFKSHFTPLKIQENTALEYLTFRHAQRCYSDWYLIYAFVGRTKNILNNFVCIRIFVYLCSGLTLNTISR